MDNLRDTLKVEGVMSKGYGIMPKTIMQDARLTRDAKAIYAYLVSYAGAGEVAFPGTEKICKDLGFGKSETMVRHRKLLEKYGYIKIEQKRVRGKFSNNVYTIMQFPEEVAEEVETRDVQTKKDIKNPNYEQTSPYPQKRGTVDSTVPPSAGYRKQGYPIKGVPSKGGTNINRSLKINRYIKNNNKQQQDLVTKDLDHKQEQEKGNNVSERSIKKNVVVSKNIDKLLKAFWRIADKRESDTDFMKKLLLAYGEEEILEEIKKIDLTYPDRSLIREPKALLTSALRIKFDKPNPGVSVSTYVAKLRKELDSLSTRRFGLDFDEKIQALKEMGHNFPDDAVNIVRTEVEAKQERYKDVYMN